MPFETKPICDECWKRRKPHREPVRLKQPEPEVCCLCGNVTESGIYVRVRMTEGVAEWDDS